MPAFPPPLDAKQEIHCLIFVEGTKRYEEQIQVVFEDTNRYLEREGVEIVLVPSACRQITFAKDSAREMLGQLREAAAAVADVWDLAIAFTNGPLLGSKGQSWTGVIEKRQSRHIIIKYLNRNTLLHEIGHALGLPHGTGIMSPRFKTSSLHLDKKYIDVLRHWIRGAFSSTAYKSTTHGASCYLSSPGESG